jgi:hypothetical protein
MRELEHHAGAFCPPLLFPVIQPIRDQPPAYADKRLLCYNLLSYAGSSRERELCQ